MLDEQMDDMIREAAEKHHPAYHDDAWEKMQQKLDAEMPQKPAKKRYIYYLLLLLLMGGAVYTSVQYFSGKDKSGQQSIASTENNHNNIPGAAATNTTTAGTPAAATSNPIEKGDDNRIRTANDVSSPVTGTTGLSNSVGIPSGRTAANNTPPAGIKKPVGNGAASDLVTARGKRNKAKPVPANDQAVVDQKSNTFHNKKDRSITGTGDAFLTASQKTKLTSKGKTRMRISSPSTTGEAGTGEETVPAATSIAGPEATTTAINSTKKTNEKKEKETTADSSKKEDLAKGKKTNTDSTQPVTASKEKNKKKGFAGNFGITVSAGTDASFIKLDKIGKATFIYGAGLSYDIGKRFTVQAGFYVSKKIYSAGADQYNPPGGNYPYFTGADAVCKVYEIPVSVNYNFGQRRKHSWFAGVGLSSFLMKKEDYVYNYKNPAGQVYTYKHAVSDENKHYFSVLNLAAGYKYNFNDRISLMAAPFVKLPLAGVGEGAIKLKSAGVLFTATVKPFARRKK